MFGFVGFHYRLLFGPIDVLFCLVSLQTFIWTHRCLVLWGFTKLTWYMSDLNTDVLNIT